MRQMLRASVGIALLSFATGACGNASGGGPKSASSDAPSERAESSAEATGATQSEAAAQGPSKPSCADGTCFACGEMVCLSGFFCETPRPGAAPSCGSLSACPQTPTCACLTPHLAGCTCQEKNGVAHVTCGGLSAR